MIPKREGLAHSVQVRLAQHAKATGADPNLVIQRYATERMLYRLSRSAHAESFVLKGALLLLAWLGENHRPTRDADLLGFGEMSEDRLREIFGGLCTIEVEPDGMTYLAGSIRVDPIREGDAYGGQRVNVDASLGSARATVQVDVGVGDAVTPAPEWLDYPCLLDMPPARLRAYPRESVIAEKIHAMEFLGLRNSRLKDYYDVRALLREGRLDPAQLAAAIASTFARRRTALPEGLPQGLQDDFPADDVNQARWKAFLVKNRLDAPSLDEAVTEISALVAESLAAARGMKVHR